MAIQLREGVLPEAFAELERSAFPDPWAEHDFAPECLGISLWQDDHCLCYIYGRQILDELEIYRVATHGSHRRRGYADLTLRWLRDYATSQGIARILLEVAAGNDAALALYEKQGFQRQSLRRGYYHNGEDAVLMEYAVR